MSSFKPLILESDWRGCGYQLPGPASAPAAAGSGGQVHCPAGQDWSSSGPTRQPSPCPQLDYKLPEDTYHLPHLMLSFVSRTIPGT